MRYQSSYMPVNAGEFLHRKIEDFKQKKYGSTEKYKEGHGQNMSTRRKICGKRKQKSYLYLQLVGTF